MRRVGRQGLFVFVLALAISLMSPLTEVCADNLQRPIRIGALNDSWGPTPMVAGLRDGLEALGYREDRDYVFGIRFTQGDLTTLPMAAHALVKLGVDLIFAESDAAAKAAQLATRQVPIVFPYSSDPIGSGLIESFARPGGNITGVAGLTLDLGPKRLQLFQEMIPGLQRVLFPYDAADALALKQVKSYRQAARQLGLELVEKPVHTSEEARDILTRMQPGDIDGILPPLCCSMNIPGLVLDIMIPKRIPAMFETAFFVESGSFASYGPDYYASGKQSARLIDKILKGQKPADIPVEVNSKIEFVINLKAVKALGLTIAPEVLFQADRIIR